MVYVVYGVSFCAVSHSVYFRMVDMSARLPLGKELPIRFNICFLCCVYVPHLGFDGENIVLNAPVPGHCSLFTLAYQTTRGRIKMLSIIYQINIHLRFSSIDIF